MNILLKAQLIRLFLVLENIKTAVFIKDLKLILIISELHLDL
jgi:hypothetical protein